MKRESVSVAPGRSTERVRPALIFMALVTLAFVGMRALELYYDHPLKTLDGAMQTWYAVDLLPGASNWGMISSPIWARR